MRRALNCELTYILPIRTSLPQVSRELSAYLRWLARCTEVIVVDGSPAPVFAAHADAWSKIVRHVAPHADLATPMGKVGGVLTGVRLASHDRIIIADDDVRYDHLSLSQVASALDSAEVVRPQNYFRPMPWHARIDTGRMLLNRMSGGDWPGTLGVRRSVLRATGGYDGSVMFENLELVRTVQAAGGREQLLPGAYVLRHPASTGHFWNQRVRQAYDEMARPARLALQLALLPAVVALVRNRRWTILATATVTIAGIAEVGRRRSGGARVFPGIASLVAPVWVAERAVCIWLALGARVVLGGIPYRGAVLRHAATPMRVLRERHSDAYQGTRVEETGRNRPRKPRRRSA